MRVYGNWNTYKQFAYQVVTPAVNTPVSLSDVKLFLRIDSSNTVEDSLLTMMINVATDYCEKYTKRDLISKTYITYRDVFTSSFEIRRSLLLSISSIKYYDTNNVLQTLDPSGYIKTTSTDFSSIVPASNVYDWNITDGPFLRPDAIQIQFVAGYGPNSTDVPSLLRLGILQHIANLYEARGDTGPDGYNWNSTLPATTKSIYDSFKIKDLNPNPTNISPYYR